MEAVSSTGDARLILVGAIVTALITAGGPIVLALVNRRVAPAEAPPPDIDLVAELDSDLDRVSRENDRLHRENENLVRDNERLREQLRGSHAQPDSRD